MATDWTFAETWQVGDKLDAATLTRRIQEPNTLLLRRPVTIAHGSADITLANNSTLALPFNTIDKDDDGMVQTDTPATDFYAQREGTYQIWYSITYLSNGTSTDVDSNICLDLGANRRWDNQSKCTATTGTQFMHNCVATVYCTVGQSMRITTWQASGSAMTIKAVLNSPRIVVMWLGLT